MSESLPPPSKRCSQCGVELPDAGTNGLCPACLMVEAMKPSGPKARWEPPSAEELAKLLPQYEITRMLGRGGMGAVYQGTQKSLDRTVAIKILSNDLETADASFAERFKNEARAMAKLSHPGIVAVFDSGETANGLLYIVMEFIEGTDVSRMIAGQGRLHTEHAMAITAHVCDALAYAHERGIIHRDIKPANIMVGYDGVVKVADFGLAKMTHTQNTGLTQSGMAMGTLHYMAPEALMLGSAVDHRADIYAVGVMLYQMLTGKVPQGLFELPSLQVPGLDPRYDGIIGKALREDRDLRYPSVLDMRQDLDAIMTQPVVKVEASAEKAPAALPTMVRPQRPGGQPYHPPSQTVIVRTERKSSPLLWTAVVALAALAGWLYLKKPAAAGAPSLEVPAAGNPPVADTSPASAVKDPSTAITSNPAEATKDRPFVNSLGMKFVPVPGTKVLMCIHETRHKDYEVYATQNSGVNSRWRTARVPELPKYIAADDDPLFGVNWDEAKAFCEWLSRKEDVKYRLPSDREWSHAVGIADHESGDALPVELGKASHVIYPWGQGWPPPAGAGNFSDESVGETTSFSGYIRGYNDKHPGPSPVMSFPPNKLGFHDLGGNVSEWCEDWYDDTKKDRVLRDSNWYCSDPNVLLSSRRFNLPPDYTGGHIGRGFRCVLVLDAVSASSVAFEDIPVPPWLAEAKRRGGKLQIEGSVNGMQATLGKAAEHADFVEVFASKAGWVARRAGGEVHYGAFDQQKAVFGVERDIVSVSMSRETVLVSQAGECQYLSPQGLAAITGFKSRHGRTAMKLNMGSLLFDREGILLDSVIPDANAGSVRIPDDYFKGALQIFEAGWSCVGLFPDGPPKAWSLHAKGAADPSIHPEKFRGCVQGDGPLSGLVLLRDNRGEVFLTSDNGKSTNRQKGDPLLPPDDLPSAIRVRAGALSKTMNGTPGGTKTGLCAAQMTDGTWRAWGNGGPLIEKVNKLGVVLDLDPSDPDGFLIWVEPDQAALAASGAKPSPTAPPQTTPPAPSITKPQPPPATPVLRTGPTTWTDTKGRSITATFKAIASGNVLLDIAGKVTPVPINTLSVESQKLARTYHDQSNPATTNDPAQATKDRPFVNSLGMKFVPVPGTKVLMCIHETRRKDYEAYALANTSVNPKWKTVRVSEWPEFAPTESYPVFAVSWNESKAFCDWLSSRENATYRLPSDREWSHAVGIADKEDEKMTPESLSGGHMGVFQWGADWPPPKNTGNFRGIECLVKGANNCLPDYDDGFIGPAPVMTFRPNNLGLHDLAGNVMEWCEDWINAKQQKKVLRGSPWYEGKGSVYLLASHRFGLPPDVNQGNSGRGFRCVVELPDATLPTAPKTSATTWKPLRAGEYADSRDISIRGRFKSGQFAVLAVRGSEAGEKPESKYWAALQTNGLEVVLFREWIKPPPGTSRFANSTLARTSLKQAIPKDKEYTLTFTAVGDQLEVLVDDVPVIKVVDKMLPGRFAGSLHLSNQTSGTVEWKPAPPP